MFFEGTLQEGISSAVQQAKLVVCFVTDGQAESQKWETEFLEDDALKGPLAKEAVVLKLQAGSTEAGYLAAIFPLPKTPTLVCIRNGELKEYIVSGVSKEEFFARTAKALGVAVQTSAASASSSSGTTSQINTASQQPTVAIGHTSTSATQQTTPSPAPAPTPAPPTVTNQSPSSSPAPASGGGGISNTRIQTLLAERVTRGDAERKKAEERRRTEAAQGKKKEEEPSAAKPKAPADAQSKHMDELKKRQKQDKEARQRVLQQIEDDKAARRAQREEQRRQNLGGGGGGAAEQAAPSQSRPMHVDGTCKLQVRLFDGSTVRGQFEASKRLDPDVRKWVDEASSDQGGGGGVGYAFKVIQTPAPSRSIDVGEEGSTLAELGLAPSATLVLMPARKGTVGAYGDGGGGGTNVVMRVIGFLLGTLSEIWGFVVYLFSAAPGPTDAGQERRETEQQPVVASGRDQGRNGGVNRLRDKKDEQQFYNGNSTNFQPRHDDDDEK